LQNTIAQSSGTLAIEYQRNTATGTADIVATSGVVAGKKAIGISMSEVGIVKFGFFQSLYQGAELTVIEIKEIAVGMWALIYGLIKGNASVLSEVSGPVGIVSLVGQARSLGISYLLGFIALISINLAVLNAIPFPALDGGRAMFTIIEVIIRRKIKPAILNWANSIGFGILIILMLFVTYQDIVKLIK
jgi:regulator of sigma E protease